MQHFAEIRIFFNQTDFFILDFKNGNVTKVKVVDMSLLKHQLMLVPPKIEGSNHLKS